MSGYLGMTADVVPADAAELVEADLRQRLDALRDAVAAHHPDADAAAVTAKMFDVLMEQAAQRLREADLDPNRERCLELLAERGVLRHLDTPWARIR